MRKHRPYCIGMIMGMAVGGLLTGTPDFAMGGVTAAALLLILDLWEGDI